MKNLFTLYLILVMYKGSSLNDRYRRSEVIISGFNDTGNNLPYDMKRFIEVTFNGVIVHTRTLSEQNLESRDEFVYQDTANEYDPKMNLSGYFEKNQSLSDLVFHGPLQINLTYFVLINGQKLILEKYDLDTDIRCAANADRFRHFKGNRVQFSFFISYWCRGYTGKGCQYECDDSPSSKYECFYDTGEKICKNSSYNNPPDCNLFNSTCLENKCKNNGICIYVNPVNTHCECLSGYIGDTCQNFTCEKPCNSPYGKCIGPNICNCLPGRKGSQCENKSCTLDHCMNLGTCIIKDNERLCDCLSAKYTGKRCEFECNPTCKHGICTEYKKITYCQCNKGFYGEKCDQTKPNPKNIYEKGYVSAKNQKIIYLLVIIGLAIFAVAFLGYGGYLRRKKIARMKKNQKSKSDSKMANRVNSIFPGTMQC